MCPTRDVAVCLPVFNDWESATVVVRRVAAACKERGVGTRFLLVDDGSTEPAPAGAEWRDDAGGSIEWEILRLRRNVGHQKAIAVGLATLARRGGVDAVVVMDSDGEDLPEDVPRLLDAVAETGGSAVVFARRAKRSESLGFRLGYRAFRALHRLLTGRRVEVGNFSVVPFPLLGTVVSVAEIWVHYAAGVMRSRLPVETVPLARGTRIAGRSRMNLVSLVGHGLGALSVFAEEIVVRVLAACVVGAALATVALVGAIVGDSVTAGLVAVLLGSLFVGAAIQGVLAAVVLYRLKSMAVVMPLGDAEKWILPAPGAERWILPAPGAER